MAKRFIKQSSKNPMRLAGACLTVAVFLAAASNAGARNLIQDGDFEGPTWTMPGNGFFDPHYCDAVAGREQSHAWDLFDWGADCDDGIFTVESNGGSSPHSGAKNFLLASSHSDREVGQIVSASSLAYSSRYRLQAWVKCSANIQDAYLRIADQFEIFGYYGPSVKQASFGGSADSETQYRLFTVDFTREHPGDLFILTGYHTPNSAAWMRIDDVTLVPIDSTMDLVDDSGFENQNTLHVLKAPWTTSGSGTGGTEIGLVGFGEAYAGANNAFLRLTTGWRWLSQKIATAPGFRYTASAKVRTSANVTGGYFHVSDGYGRVVARVPFGPSPNSYTTLSFDFYGTGLNPIEPGDPMMTLVIGYNAPGADSWVRVDELHVFEWKPFTPPPRKGR